MIRRRFLPVFSILPSALALAAVAAEPPLFRHEGFAQLARGQLGNAGQNLFVSRRGALELVNWFDLDRDGFPEIAANNEHSPFENSDSLIYFQDQADGFRSLLPVEGEGGAFEKIAWQRRAARHSSFLPSMGAGRAVIADLDRDGFNEIVFPNFYHGSTHDHFPVFVYWGSEEGYGPRHLSELPSETSAGVAVADLDGNGRPELIVANLGKEDDIVTAAARAAGAPPPDDAPFSTGESFVYWQSLDGFAVDRLTRLPTRFAVDVKALDLDGDNHTDLVFLEGGDVPALHLFYGAADGDYTRRQLRLPVKGRGVAEQLYGEVAAGDLNGDGRPDLVAAAAGAEVEIFWNSAQGFAAAAHQMLPASTPLGCVVADVTADGRADLVVGNYKAPGQRSERRYHSEITIYRGSTSGLSADDVITLPALGCASLRAGDINGDGFVDLAVANTRDDHTFDVPLYVYWGGRHGLSAATRAELTAFGAAGVAIGDLNRDGRPDLFVGNRSSGPAYGGGPINSFVYWGNPDRGFSHAVQTKIPLKGGGISSAGDLFDDGRGAIAYTEDGGVSVVRFDDERGIASQTHIAVSFAEYASSVADLDRDGRLDLVVAGIQGNHGAIAVLRGCDGGFAAPEIQAVDIPVISTAVADLDGDGALELLIAGRGGWARCPIRPDGVIDVAHATTMKMDFQIQRVSVADLDNDGFPEVIAARYRQMSTRRNAIDSAIYWNRRGRFSPDDLTTLPTFGAHWISAARADGADRLDLVFSNYHGETMRTPPLLIYRADDQGHYDAHRRDLLPAYSSSANMVADLDGDGFRDLIVFNHTGPDLQVGLKPKSGDHGVGSWVYWGGREAYKVAHRSWFATFGPHMTTNAELGDVLRRRSYETYTSPWENQSFAEGEYMLAIGGQFTGRASCRVAVQTRDGGEWLELSPAGHSVSELMFHLPIMQSVDRLRYRLQLDTGGAGTGPSVTSIALRPEH